jgi:hypothetical protein
MPVIHVSGSPGSGKTTLVALLRDCCTVVDTDELIQDDEHRLLETLRDTGKHEEALLKWREILTQKIVTLYNHNVGLLVLVGILNHCSPNGTPFELAIPLAFKAFLDVPRAELLRRFYGRFGIELRQDAEFWIGVETGRWGIPSSTEYIRAHEVEKEWHLRHGYELCASEKVEAFIRTRTDVQLNSA